MNIPSVGDLVKVRSVPKACTSGWAVMLGHVGVVREISKRSPRALVQSFTIAGRTGTLAFIDLAALEPVDDPAWSAAAVEYERWSAQVQAEGREWNRKRWELLERLAARHRMTVADLIELAEAACVSPVPFKPSEE